MYDHIGFGRSKTRLPACASTPRRSVRSATCCASQDDSGGRLGPKGGRPSGSSTSPERRAGVHVAFRAPNRAAVDRSSEGLNAGGRDNGGPGLRADYSPTYYAAFLFDPDGNNVEAVCLRTELQWLPSARSF